MFDSRERSLLLQLARDSIVAYLERSMIIEPPDEEFLGRRYAAFVTLKIGDELRGCIGCTDASDPIGNTVIHCSISAAFRDPRFPALTKEEYPSIRVEISVLSPFERTDPRQIIPGTHGIMITNHRSRGLLLPQVATEYGWDRETFLDFSCRKAGLPADAWRHPDTIVETFTAMVIREEEAAESFAPEARDAESLDGLIRKPILHD